MPSILMHMTPYDSNSLLNPLATLEDLQTQQLTLTHSLKKQLAEKELEKQDQLREFLLGLI